MARAPRLVRSARRLAATARAFVRARRGVAAIEFAIILPLMMLVYVGVVELTQALANSRKVTLLSRTLADLAARGLPNGAEMTQADVDKIFAAGKLVLAPFDAANTKMVISSIGVYKVGSDYKAYVCSSSVATPKAPSTADPIRPFGAPTNVDGLRPFPAIPEAFKQDKMRFVLAEVGATYSYVLGNTYEAFKLAPIVLLPEQTPWPVRGGKTYNGNANPEIVLPGSGGQPCPATI